MTVSSEEVPRGKPAPDVYLEAAKRLGVDPADCAAIEDSHNGIRSAKAAGMRVIAIPNPRYPPASDALSAADAVLATITDLTPATVEALEQPFDRESPVEPAVEPRPVPAQPSVHGVSPPVPGEQKIRATLALEDVLATTSSQGVSPSSAEEGVSPGAAEKDVSSGAADERVVSASALQGVVSGEALDRVAPA